MSSIRIEDHPDFDENGKPYPHPVVPANGDLCSVCKDYDKCSENARPCETPGHAMYCPPSMYAP